MKYIRYENYDRVEIANYFTEPCSASHIERVKLGILKHGTMCLEALLIYHDGDSTKRGRELIEEWLIQIRFVDSDGSRTMFKRFWEAPGGF